jgi:hypothetical protein
MPDDNCAVSLIKRLWKTDSGDAELSILWNSTGFTPGTPVLTINENRNITKSCGVLISEISAPSDEGLVIETDFIAGTGSGSNSSGDISPETGFRIYSPGSFFIAKVTNLHGSSNRIKLGYNYAKVPVVSLG